MNCKQDKNVLMLQRVINDTMFLTQIGSDEGKTTYNSAISCSQKTVKTLMSILCVLCRSILVLLHTLGNVSCTS